MDNYKHYSTEDLLQDEFFRDWVLGDNREAGLAWERFLLSNPDKQTEITKAKALLLALREVDPDPGLEAGARMWQAIDQRTDQNYQIDSVQEERQIYPFFRWQGYAAAALVLGFCAWCIYGMRNAQSLPATYQKQIADSRTELLEYTNPTMGQLEFTLPDGSVVVLEPNSKISYDKAFDGMERRVFLSGQGFFEVVKNENKPFLVFADNVVTRVVGTRFTVKNPLSGSDISVAVKSGLVKVFTIDQYSTQGNNPDAILLKANEQANYEGAKKLLTKVISEKPEIIRAPTKFADFNFEKTSAKDVFATLSEAYGVKIQYDQHALINCNLTADLDNEPLFKKLDIICRTIDATYEVWGTSIVVTAKGCPID